MSEAPNGLPYSPAPRKPRQDTPASNAGSYDKQELHVFKSVSAFTRFVCEAKQISRRATSMDTDYDFAPMPYTEVVSLGLMGGAWEQGAKNLLKAPLPKIEVARDVKQSILSQAPAGFAPLVSAYLSSEPDSMLTYEDAPSQARTLKILINSAVSANVSASSVLNRGRALLSVVRALESKGVKVQIDIGMRISPERIQPKGHLTAIFGLKPFNETIAPARLAFCVCNVSLMRRLFLRLVECSENFYPLTEDNYGYPSPIESNEHDVILPPMGKDAAIACETGQDALNYVINNLPAFAAHKLKASN